MRFRKGDKVRLIDHDPHDWPEGREYDSEEVFTISDDYNTSYVTIDLDDDEWAVRRKYCELAGLPDEDPIERPYRI